MSRSIDQLHRPIDPSALALFRIVFGLVMAVDVVHMWVSGTHIGPAHEFRGHYALLPFLEGWRPPEPNVVFPLMLGACLLIAAGALTRAAAALFCAVFTYTFVLDPERFNNHEYLIALLAGLLACTQSDAVWSVRARRLGPRPTIPFWQLGVFRFLVCLVYLYGGLAKLDADWLRGEPVAAWVASEGDHALLGYWFRQRWVGLAIGYVGVVFDLCIWVLLLWRPTRSWAMLLVLIFHLTNSQLFDIGVFPWLGIASLVVFLEPDTPRRVRERFLGTGPTDGLAPTAPPPVPAYRRNLVTAGLLLFVTVQIVVPFRHWLHHGWVEWNQTGKSFSWRMMLSHKEPFVGMIVVDRDRLQFYEVDQGGRQLAARDEPGRARLKAVEGKVYLVPSRLLDGDKTRRAKSVWGDPRLLHQYARQVARDARALGIRRPAVFVDAIAMLNGRPPQYLVDPHVNLANANLPLLGTPDWVVPLEPNQPTGDYFTSLQEWHDRVHAYRQSHPRDMNRIVLELRQASR